VLQNIYPAQRTIQQWFIPTAFAVQPAGTFGNVARTTVTQPGTWNIDMSLNRIFKFTERWNLEVRADGFNIVNHGQLDALTGTTPPPGTTAASPTTSLSPAALSDRSPLLQVLE
jgi:hypothetical protein